MAGTVRETFATEVNAETLAEVRRLAEAEGRQFDALVNEAFDDLLEKHRQAKPRDHVLRAYQNSHNPYGALYKKLAT